MMKAIAALLSALGVAIGPPAWAAGPQPLVLEAKIPLGEVKGRVDHFAFDPGRERLFVAELGNDSVGVIDLKQRKVIRTITGLHEPQGIGYVPSTDTVYVANAGDGSVDLFRGADLAPDGRIALGDDADNVRIDAKANRVFIGYGNGAIAVIDPSSRRKIGDIPLEAHPESFQLDGSGTKLFVNVPDVRQVVVLDRAAGRQVRTLPTKGARANFPMAVDDKAERVIVAFRNPPTLIVYGTRDGGVIAEAATCGDADDVFVDAKRRRLYVSCGAGVIDVLERQGVGYARIARVPTAPGARTSFLAPALDRLFVGVRAGAGGPAAVWVFRPGP
jgi:YVTN family beta-propeller protein